MAHAERLKKWADEIEAIAAAVENDCPTSVPGKVERASNAFAHALYDAAREVRRGLGN